MEAVELLSFLSVRRLSELGSFGKLWTSFMKCMGFLGYFGAVSHPKNPMHFIKLVLSLPKDPGSDNPIGKPTAAAFPFTSKDA